MFLLFETACDGYDWLNGAVAYGLATQVASSIAVDVFKVSGCGFLFAADARCF